MNAEQLARLGKAMRAAQRRYFRSRLPSDLEASKSLEKQFDGACEAILEQPSLFGGEG